ncbi:probable peroxisomal acyl-coenzyme A oxidase 1 [Drosophila novamexicana]|uniref:probable peroxisomal acyl-coenzyme A oxidase 1 n=1 Tax=Drosophila novamexicana TaxID=47314 RepID=UPI0011E5A893|nr:probable peroxisomal acyl-coenzyme A oxidase 1 [Drosophila novamexicana]
MEALGECIELRREREGATIASEDFAVWWAGGRHELEERRALENYFFNDPEFDDAVHPSCMSYKQRYEHALTKGTKFLAKLREWQRSQRAQQPKDKEEQELEGTEDSINIKLLYDYRMLLSGPVGTALFQQSFPLRLHFSMFLPTLLSQGNAEQQRRWVGRAWRLDGIVGTYAQTELGHGSYIRGLETRADYDAEREQFVLNTPTLSAYKWWPGGLGQTANMVVVLAQLYIRGKHHGLQQFLVRIRDEQTHEPLPGIDVGDIGPKLGANGVNNGFLGFRNVRIPRDQMLMKNAQVLADGRFVQAAQPLLVYGTMVFVRVIIVRDVMFGLLQAATIATRYSAVRRQSPIEPNAPEPQILDHVTQQAKILPQIARGVCYRLAADVLWSIYQRVMQQLEAAGHNGSNGGRELPELHALSCCLKAVCTEGAAEGIDVLRKACGGHGYMSSANFDSIQGLASAAFTYEGEHTVLLLQTARFLLRQHTDALKRKVLPASVTYLRNASPLSWGDNLLENVARALEICAAAQLREAWQWQQEQRQHGKHTDQQANNLSGRRLTAAATLHGHAYLARNAIKQLAQLGPNVQPALYELLQQLVELFVLDTFLRQLGAVLKWNSNRISSKQLQQLEQRYEQRLGALRPNALALVDGFDFHDRVLGSTLGCWDGRVYERLMAEARRNPLNQEAVNPSYHTHLQPLFRYKL